MELHSLLNLNLILGFHFIGLEAYCSSGRPISALLLVHYNFPIVTFLKPPFVYHWVHIVQIERGSTKKPCEIEETFLFQKDIQAYWL